MTTDPTLAALSRVSDRARDLLAAARVDDSVLLLRPDYRAALVVAEGLRPGPSDPAGEALLAAAEEKARAALAGGPPESLPEIEAWREAYRAFGAKPQRTRPSVDALLRRLDDGLPRVDRITDTYNAVSVGHLLPLGGEDLDAYVGAPVLTRADGSEPFDTTAAGEPVVEHPDAGEVVWRDDAGVTCRRWNWRQCTRTRITGATTSALFVLDGLGALGPAGLDAATDALTAGLRALGPDVALATRVIGGRS